MCVILLGYIFEMNDRSTKKNQISVQERDREIWIIVHFGVKIRKQNIRNATHTFCRPLHRHNKQPKHTHWRLEYLNALISPACSAQCLSFPSLLPRPPLPFSPACTALRRKVTAYGVATRPIYATRMDWMIWKIAEPQTTNRKSASSHGPTGYWSSLVFWMGGHVKHFVNNIR